LVAREAILLTALIFILVLSQPVGPPAVVFAQRAVGGAGVRERAEAAFDAKRYAEAAEAYKQLFTLDSTDERAAYRLGRCYNVLKQYADAVSPLKDAIRLDPTDVAALDELGDAYRNLRLLDDALATYRAAVQCLVTFDERANLAAIKVPVLCLAAEHDGNAPPAVLEKMAAKIPGARYVCLPGLGHMPNLEAPQAFDAAIFNFLNAALAPKG